MALTTVPANLPPDYYAAESEFRAATTPGAKRAALERMLAIMPVGRQIPARA